MTPDEAVARYWKAVSKIAHRASRTTPSSVHLEVEDHIQDGYVGLLSALERLDDDKHPREITSFLFFGIRAGVVHGTRAMTHGCTKPVQVYRPELVDEDGSESDWIEERVVDGAPLPSAVVEMKMDTDSRIKPERLTARQQLIIEGKAAGKTLDEIGTEIGGCKSAVHYDHKRMRRAGVI